MKKTVYLVIATFSLLFSTGHGQITITGNEHVFNNYSESFGKNVTFSLNDDDVNNIFVFKDDKMKNVSKIFDKIEINGFIKGSKTWVVHGITTHKKKNYLHISQNNNNLYLWVDKTDYVNKMQNISIYDNYIDMLNENNIFLNKSASPIDLSSKYLLCDTACHIKWTGYELVDETINFFYSFIDKNKSSSDTYSIKASTITQDKFVNIHFIDECLLLEQNFKDSLEDEKLHAFLISQKMQGDVDTVFLFKPVQGWHHNSIRTVISTNTNDITLYAPDSTYSQMSYTEYLDYVTRRGHKGEMLRMNLAKHADSVNSIGFMLQRSMDLLEDSKYHAFILKQDFVSEDLEKGDTVFMFSFNEGYHGGKIKNIYDPTVLQNIDISNGSDMSYSDYRSYILRRNGEGEQYRKELAKQRDSISVMYRWMSYLEKKKSYYDKLNQKQIFLIGKEYAYGDYSDFGLELEFYNCFKKAIKYIKFETKSYNIFGDLQGDYFGKKVSGGRCVGPLEPGESAKWRFDELYYDKNDIIQYVCVTKVTFTFIDNTTITYTDINNHKTNDVYNKNK